MLSGPRSCPRLGSPDVQWVAADLRTGLILADLPGIFADYPLRHTIGIYDTATVHLLLDGAPPNWERAVQEGASVLALYDETLPGNPIMWAGYVVTQTRNVGEPTDGTADQVDLSLATLEAYFDRRALDNVTYTSEGQNAIIADLTNNFIIDSMSVPGLTQLQVVYTDPGTLRTFTYLTTDWATVYTRMTQLSALQGGPEFTVSWAFSTDGMSIIPTLTIADRIGSPASAGLGPATTWSMPGCVSSVTQTRDYSSGQGANRVRAYSSGQGSSTPMSAYQTAADYEGRPTFDYVYSPSSSITDVPTLTSYAQQAVAFLEPGAVALALTGAIMESPKLGSDWVIGDDIGYSVGGLDANGNDTVLAFPGGISGVGRAVAVEIGGQSGYMPTLISPILAQATLYEDDGD